MRLLVRFLLAGASNWLLVMTLVSGFASGEYALRYRNQNLPVPWYVYWDTLLLFAAALAVVAVSGALTRRWLTLPAWVFAGTGFLIVGMTWKEPGSWWRLIQAYLPSYSVALASAALGFFLGSWRRRKPQDDEESKSSGARP